MAKVELTTEELKEAEEIYSRAAIFQDKFWEGLGELEGALGFDVDGTRDLRDYDLQTLIDEHNEAEGEEEELVGMVNCDECGEENLAGNPCACERLVTCHMNSGHGLEPHVENRNCIDPLQTS